MKISYKPVQVLWEKGHLKFDLVNLKCTNQLIYKINTQSGVSLAGLTHKKFSHFFIKLWFLAISFFKIS